MILFTCCLYPVIFASNENLDENFYLNNMISPQVNDMFRYGNIETSLFTGKLNLSIPIYQLEDPDFNLNIALRYNSEGFKPRQNSGYVGYNWFLDAGGCITREIRNLPDEYTIHYGNISMTSNKPQELGMLCFVKQKKIDKDIIFNMDSLVYCNSYSYYNLIECDSKVDYLPDLFHFNFCGYSGTFMINNHGKAIVVDGDFIEANIETVHLSNVSTDVYYVPKKITKISITTTSGYTYIFGGDTASVEYSLAVQENEIQSQYPPIIKSWYLKKIIAPNKRVATFYYKNFAYNTSSKEDPLWLFNKYYDYFHNNTSISIFEKKKIYYQGSMKYAVTKGCYIDSIVISGKENLQVLFFNSSSAQTLYGKSHSFGQNNYVLDSIIVKTDEHVLKKAHLERSVKSCTNGAYPNCWRFLTSVKIGGIGKYLLKYDYPVNYPDLSVIDNANHQYLHDFYGYWNSGATFYLLKEIQYPTGGKQEFKYGQHDYGEERKYVISNAEDVKLQSDKESKKMSGARIESIKTYNDNQLIETKTYTYKQKNTANSSGVYYNRALTYFENDSAKGLLTTNGGCYSFLSSHIGYSYVEESIKDEATGNRYKIGYTFNTGLKTYNSSMDNTINRCSTQYTAIDPSIYYIISGVLTYDSQLTRNGHLQLVEYYKNDLLTQSIEYDYNGGIQNTTELIPQAPSSLGCIDTIIVLYNHTVSVARRLFIYPNLLRQKVTKDYVSNEDHIIKSQTFIYDSKFRIKKETMTNSIGTKYFTKHTYIDDLPTSQWHRKIPSIPNPYAVLLETNQISRPIETTFGYIDNEQEYTTGGEVKLYSMVLHADFSENNSSRLLPQRLPIDSLEKISDSLRIDITGYHLSPHKTLNLSLAKGVQDHQPIFSNGDTISYDNRYRLTCGYTFDEMNRLVRIAPYGKQETIYTWDGIYPTSQTTGNQTSTYTYIPYVGMSSMIDARGVTTYYEYDISGRLIEVYRMNNGKKEILNKYIHHIKTE